MTTFSITTELNYSELTPKTGNDTYNLNGGKLLINSDTRYGPNTSRTTGVLGAINVSASLGGVLEIDGTSVRILPFSNGTGLVPNYGLVTDANGATGELLCVMLEKHGQIIYSPGEAMPSSGWIKLRSVSQPFVAGPLNGIGCTATGTDEVGWLLLAGAQDKSHSHSRLGSSKFNGLKYYLGETNGLRGQTLQLPFVAAENMISYPGVEIETFAGSNEYFFWANAANRFTSQHCSTDSRSSFVYISNAGVLTIGKGTDLSDCGYMPEPGCKIRIPNLITQCTGNSNYGVNVTPNDNINKRYRANYISSGNIWLTNVTGSWYWSIAQAYSCYVRDLHSCDQILIQEIASEVDVDNVHVGLSIYASSPLAIYALLFQQCYNGGKVGTVSGLRAESVSNSGYPTVLVNLYGEWTFKSIRSGQTGFPSAVNGSVFLNTCTNVTIDKLETFTKRFTSTGCRNITIKEHIYADACLGTTPTTQPCCAQEWFSSTDGVDSTNIKNWPGVINSHPYNGLIFCNTANNVKLRKTGTPAEPYDTGTVNQTGVIYLDGGNNSNIKIQRNWLTAVRTSLHSGTNTSKNTVIVNNYLTDPNKVIGPQQLDSLVHGNRHNNGSVPMSYIAVYGTSMWDAFTSDTTTRASIIFVEKTAANQNAYNVDSGNPKFTSQGAVVMREVGDTITWTWMWFIKGWNGLTSFVRQGVNLTNFLFEYDLDRGNGFTDVFKILSDTNLAAEQDIDPAEGFRFKVRISCIIAGNANRIDSIRIDGTTTLELQNEALYPLDNAEVSVSGLLLGSTVAVFRSDYQHGDEPVAIALDISEKNIVLSYPYDEEAPGYILKVRKPGYDVLSLEMDNDLFNDIPVAQQENKDGFSVSVYGRANGASYDLINITAEDLRIDIGNGKCSAEDIYDLISRWQASETGIRYSEALRFDGTDIIMMNGWRFRRANPIYTDAGVDALPVVDGQPNASPDDETNGSIDFKARSVRTYYLNQQPVYTLNDFAAAVWEYSQVNGLSAQNNLLKTKLAAETAVALTASI